ncbi:MAG TPA: hypothetical protein PKV53_10490 [Anaerohalosphaeraceae bacterium]|nr:hypothetical protein [Anaerohalosphaeraceae bacterium]HPO70724.1 hypothetical protein [Anaerohalosphaeraceae bacterium]
MQKKDYFSKLGHEPALGQLWHFAGLLEGVCLTTGVKLENCFSVFLCPHLGQAGAAVSDDLTSTSLTNPHWGHLYSNIGIVLSFYNRFSARHHTRCGRFVKYQFCRCCRFYGSTWGWAGGWGIDGDRLGRRLRMRSA